MPRNSTAARPQPAKAQPAEPAPLRVVLIEDETLVRQMLKATIPKVGGLIVAAEFGEGVEALRYCLQEKPDLVVCDLHLPGMHGLEVIKELQKKLPDARVLVLTCDTDGELPETLVKLGVQGYVDKTEPLNVLVQAFQQVADGGLFFAARTKLRPAKALPVGDAPVRMGAEPLSPREIEIAQQVASGQSSKEIAYTLSLSVRTVEKHRANLMEKIGVRDVASLTRYCIKHGLVST